MGKMKTLHKRRKRRTAKQGGGKSRHRGKSGRTGSMHAKKLATRNPAHGD
jgi:hypothetical protein